MSAAQVCCRAQRVRGARTWRGSSRCLRPREYALTGHAHCLGRQSPLTELVESLPYDERRAVQARIVHERSYSEIAAELRCSELVVRKRVSRGLAHVREQLKET